jgi:hypothetical protein
LKDKDKIFLDEIDEWYCQDCISRIQREEAEEA